MVRNYVRKTSKERPSEENLKKALGDVLRGVLSVRKVAQQYGLTKTTVGKYAKLHHKCGLIAPVRVKSPAKTILSEEIEKELCAYLKKCALMNHGLKTTIPNSLHIHLQQQIMFQFQLIGIKMKKLPMMG